jgi:hypothetical protein
MVFLHTDILILYRLLPARNATIQYSSYFGFNEFAVSAISTISALAGWSRPALVAEWMRLWPRSEVGKRRLA